jgi:NADH dehydrogenase [ubiquinone] 1 alpha subcomplex assembly factor 7
VSGTGLAATFRRLIAATGPISLAQYMGESNARYYASRDPLGTAGDFVTAPEISQMFGELAGLWLADIWHRAGRPGPVHYVELGPGRGTLARDALRAMASAGLRPQVHFVEGSDALRAVQADAVPGAQFHGDLSTLPGDAPLLLAANEFLDALPVRQLVKTPQGWRERMVALDARGRFVFTAGQVPMDAAVPEERREADEGAIIETCPPPPRQWRKWPAAWHGKAARRCLWTTVMPHSRPAPPFRPCAHTAR